MEKNGRITFVNFGGSFYSFIIFFQSKQLDDYVSLDRLNNTVDGYVSEQYNSLLYSDYIDGFQQNLSNEIERKVEQEFIDGILVMKITLNMGNILIQLNLRKLFF